MTSPKNNFKMTGVITDGEEGTSVASDPATDNPALAMPPLLRNKPANPDA